jgi:hypothetical protein
MGASAPKSETVVKGGKPFIVREWLSPEYLTNLAGIGTHYGERARQAAATRQSNVNRYLGLYGVDPVYDPYTTAAGEVIRPYQAPDLPDTASLIDPEMFKPVSLSDGSGGVKKRKDEARSTYASMINAATNKASGGTDLSR